MSNLIEQIAETIQGLLSGTISNCFVGDFPSLSIEGVAVKLSGGNDTTRYFGGVSDDVYRPRVTLVARSESYAEAVGWLASAKSILEGYSDGSNLSIFLDEAPAYTGRDEQKFHEIQAIYKLLVKE